MLKKFGKTRIFFDLSRGLIFDKNSPKRVVLLLHFENLATERADEAIGT